MHAVDGVDREAGEEPLLDHRLAAALALLGRLEDHVHRPGEVRLFGEAAGGAEQHGRVPVVAAGVHLAGNGRAIVAAGRLLDVERVEVGAQADRPLARAIALDRADDAGLGDPFGDLDPPAAQRVGDELRRAGLLEAGFGMAMDVAPDGDQLRLIGLELVDET